MAIRFKDKDGKIIAQDYGNPNPERFIEVRGLPEGTTWEEVDGKELNKVNPVNPGVRLLKKREAVEFEALVDFIEEELAPGKALRQYIQRKVAEKMNG